MKSISGAAEYLRGARFGIANAGESIRIDGILRCVQASRDRMLAGGHYTGAACKSLNLVPATGVEPVTY